MYSRQAVARCAAFGFKLHVSLKMLHHRVEMPSQFYQVELLALAHADIVLKLFSDVVRSLCGEKKNVSLTVPLAIHPHSMCHTNSAYRRVSFYRH